MDEYKRQDASFRMQVGSGGVLQLASCDLNTSGKMQVSGCKWDSAGILRLVRCYLPLEKTLVYKIIRLVDKFITSIHFNEILSCLTDNLAFPPGIE